MIVYIGYLAMAFVAYRVMNAVFLFLRIRWLRFRLNHSKSQSTKLAQEMLLDQPQKLAAALSLILPFKKVQEGFVDRLIDELEVRKRLDPHYFSDGVVAAITGVARKHGGGDYLRAIENVYTATFTTSELLVMRNCIALIPGYTEKTASVDVRIALESARITRDLVDEGFVVANRGNGNNSNKY